MKPLQYITIALFTLASVWMGCKQGGGMNQWRAIDSFKAPAAKQVIKPNYSDSITINMRILMKNQRILREVIRCRQKRDELEIEYLRTANEKYRKLGNKYIDSIHYYAKQMRE